MMDQEEIKRKLLGLWEKTTHNSKEFLSVLFDYYFDIDYIEYKEVDGKIVSAVCGIPFTFGYGQDSLKGIYLLPLSAEEGFRKKGLLSELLGNFNKRLEKDFDFSFLVPHTALLADYFGTLGYHSSFYILEERFTPLHDFRNDYMLSIEDSEDRIKELKKLLFDEIFVVDNSLNTNFRPDEVTAFVKSIENKSSSAINLIHTDKDWDYLLLGNSIAKLNQFVSYDSDGNITGVAFTQKDDVKHTKVVACYVSDSCSYYILLDFIKRFFSDHSMSVVTSDPKFQTIALIQQTYASANPNGGDIDSTISTIEVPLNINKLLQPQGMVKFLNFENIIKYLARSRSDIEFRLFIRDYEINKDLDSLQGSYETAEKDNSRDLDISKKYFFVVKNGNLKKEVLKEDSKSRNILNLSKKEISELLLRKNDSSNVIMEAFGIPRLNLQMRLLPC